MNITLTLPLWGLISTVIVMGVPIIWGLISMYFKQIAMKDKLISIEKDTKTKLLSIEIDVAHQEKSINTFKRDIEAKLDKHKAANDNKLAEMNNTMIETKMLVQLLVQDKIKK